MNPLTLVMFASGAVKLAQEVMPLIRDAFASGTIPPEDQQKVRDEYESLRNQLGGQYSGEHWELSGR